MFGVRPCRPEVGLGGCSCSRHGLSRAACVPCHAMELWREGSNGEGTQGPPWSEERNVRPLCGGNSGSQRLWRACCTQRRRAAVLLTAARARPCVRMAGHGLLLYSSEQCEVLLRGKPEPKGRGRGRGAPVTTPLLCTHVSDRSNEEAPEHVQAGPARVNGASWLRLFPLLFACLVLGGFVPAVMAPIYFLTHGDFSSSSGCAFPSVSQKQNARGIKTLDESFAKKKHWMKKNISKSS